MAASAAVNPPAPYLGGKRRLAARLVDLIESTPHRRYAEPFLGMGGVFLRRRTIASAEAINDINGEVVNLFRILQRHHGAFMDQMRWKLTSRAEFERLKRVDPATLTDLERAERFLYLQRLAFGGKIVGQNFGVDAGTPARFDLGKLQKILADINRRIERVKIEQLGYADFIRRYDGEETLFYLDPPYWGGEADYGAGVFARCDFDQLAGQLEKIRGRFILSINDTPGAREVFGRFDVQPVRTTWSIGTRAGAESNVGELIVRN